MDLQDSIDNCWFWYGRQLRGLFVGAELDLRRIYLGLSFGRTSEDYLEAAQ